METKKKVAIVLLIVGLIVIIFGALCFKVSTGYYVSQKTYGADFYTDTQHAIAITARNVQQGNANMSKYFGYTLLGIGLLEVGLGAAFITPDKKIKHKEKKEEENASAV